MSIRNDIGSTAGFISTDTFENPSVFTIILITIVLAWLTIDILNRFVFNLTYNTMGLNVNSAWHSFLILFAFVVLFVALVWVIDKYGLVPGGLSAEIETMDTPAVSIDADAVSQPTINDPLDPRNSAFIS